MFYGLNLASHREITAWNFFETASPLQILGYFCSILRKTGIEAVSKSHSRFHLRSWAFLQVVEIKGEMHAIGAMIILGVLDDPASGQMHCPGNDDDRKTRARFQQLRRFLIQKPGPDAIF